MVGCLGIEYFKENAMTNEQKAILAMAVINPDEWGNNAISVFGKQKGDEVIASRVAQLKPQYDLAIADGKYKTKAQEKVEYESSAKYLAKQQALADFIAERKKATKDLKDLADDKLIDAIKDIEGVKEYLKKLVKVIGGVK
jgi:hypothetical protein